MWIIEYGCDVNATTEEQLEMPTLEVEMVRDTNVGLQE